METGHRVTAKAKVSHKTGDDPVSVTFLPDYQDERNKEWATATPALSLSMTMKREIADLFEQGEAIDITLTRNPDQPGPGQVARPVAAPDPHSRARGPRSRAPPLRELAPLASPSPSPPQQCRHRWRLPDPSALTSLCLLAVGLLACFALGLLAGRLRPRQDPLHVSCRGRAHSGRRLRPPALLLRHFTSLPLGWAPPAPPTPPPPPRLVGYTVTAGYRSG